MECAAEVGAHYLYGRDEARARVKGFSIPCGMSPSAQLGIEQHSEGAVGAPERAGAAGAVRDGLADTTSRRRARRC